MDCSPIVPAGSARKYCLTAQPTNLIIMKEGESFANYLAAESSESWRTKIQEDLNVYPTLAIRNVASAKPSAQKESDGSNAEVTTRLSPGGAVVNLKASACDFKEILQTMKSGYYSFVIGLGSNMVMMLEKPDGSLTGFTGNATSIPIGFPGMDAKLEEFQLDINWDDEEEWRNYRIVELPFNLKEMVEDTPLGLDVQVKTPLSGTDMVVKVSQRCNGDLETEMLTGEIIRSNVINAAVTVVAGTESGEYTITLEKDVAPTSLDPGDYINFRLVKKTSSVYDKITRIINGRLT